MFWILLTKLSLKDGDYYLLSLLGCCCCRSYAVQRVMLQSLQVMEVWGMVLLFKCPPPPFWRTHSCLALTLNRIACLAADDTNWCLKWPTFMIQVNFPRDNLIWFDHKMNQTLCSFKCKVISLLSVQVMTSITSQIGKNSQDKTQAKHPGLTRHEEQAILTEYLMLKLYLSPAWRAAMSEYHLLLF